MRLQFTRARCAALSAAIMAAAHPALAATNLLSNPAFNKPSGTGPTSFTGLYNAPSAALDWEVFNNTDATTTTALEPSTKIRGGTMIHVTTGGTNNGLAQVFTQGGDGSKYSCAWIYVVSGAVGIGAGDGGGAGFGAAMFQTGAWEVLNVSGNSKPVTEMLIYSYGGGAEFYVESASVSSSQSQCKPE